MLAFLKWNKVAVSLDNISFVKEDYFRSHGKEGLKIFYCGGCPVFLEGAKLDDLNEALKMFDGEIVSVEKEKVK